jgi:hypothetical protein
VGGGRLNRGWGSGGEEGVNERVHADAEVGSVGGGLFGGGRIVVRGGEVVFFKESGGVVGFSL